MTSPAPAVGVGSREESAALFAFRLGGETYLVRAEEVVGVIATTAPMPLPRVPPYVLGLVNHDHRALAVLDLARFLERPTKPEEGPQSATRTVVLHAGPYTLGVPVTAALGIVTLRATEVRAPSGAFGPRVDPWLKGECETAHGPAAWLDLARLLEAARA